MNGWNSSVERVSGTDGLVGLAGAMEIVIRDGKHFYSCEIEFRPPR